MYPVSELGVTFAVESMPGVSLFFLFVSGHVVVRT